jgi:hypothetical protein
MSIVRALIFQRERVDVGGGREMTFAGTVTKRGLRWYEGVVWMEEPDLRREVAVE